MHFLDVSTFVQQSSSVIQTVPTLPKNELATGYAGLQLTAQIQQSNNFKTCRWRFNQETSVNIYTVAFQCQNQSQIPGTEFAVTCVRKNHQITTSLIVQFPIRSASVVARVECAVLSGNSYQQISSVSLTVTGEFHAAYGSQNLATEQAYTFCFHMLCRTS